MRGEVYPALYRCGGGTGRSGSRPTASPSRPTSPPSGPNLGGPLVLAGNGLRKYAAVFSEALGDDALIADEDLWPPWANGLFGGWLAQLAGDGARLGRSCRRAAGLHPPVRRRGERGARAGRAAAHADARVGRVGRWAGMSVTIRPLVAQRLPPRRGARGGRRFPTRGAPSMFAAELARAIASVVRRRGRRRSPGRVRGRCGVRRRRRAHHEPRGRARAQGRRHRAAAAERGARRGRRARRDGGSRWRSARRTHAAIALYESVGLDVGRAHGRTTTGMARTP